MLARQMFYYINHTPALFALVLIGSLFNALVSVNHDLTIHNKYGHGATLFIG